MSGGRGDKVVMLERVSATSTETQYRDFALRLDDGNVRNKIPMAMLLAKMSICHIFLFEDDSCKRHGLGVRPSR